VAASDRAARASGSPRANYARALAVAISCCALVFLLPPLVQQLPISEGLKEDLVTVIRYPLLLIMRGLTWIVDSLGDSFGPSGRMEPASQYLGPWTVRSLVVLSIALFLGLLFGVTLAVISKVEQMGQTRSKPKRSR